MRRELFHFLESGQTPHRNAKAFEHFLSTIIIVNLVAVTLETVTPIYARFAGVFFLIEAVTVIVFSMEYFARLWVCVEHIQFEGLPAWRARLHYAFMPLPLIDLIAILPFYAAMIGEMDLRIFVILRLFRFLKLLRYSPALDSLFQVFVQEKRALLGVLVLITGLLLLSSTVMYHVEQEAQPDAFGSIPHAMWWALATLTTVGYGDVTPVTDMGKFIGGLIMILGIGVMALPIGIIATGFANEIHRRDMVVTWGMIAKVPLFANLNARELTAITRRMQSRVISGGQLILREGDPAEGMFFILSGEVEITSKALHQSFILQTGDYFGEVGLIRRSNNLASVRAVTETSVAVLVEEDFENLMQSNKEFRHDVLKMARERILLHEGEEDAELERFL